MPRLESLLLAVLLIASGPAFAKKAPQRAELSSAGRQNVMLAQSYLDTNRIEAAEEHARSALLSDPDSALTHATMAMVKARQKDNAKARDEFNRALAIAPNDGAVLNAYGAWLCESGDRAGAEAAFQLALKDTAYATPIQPLVNAGRCALLARDWGRGDEYLRRALELAPSSRPILLMLAEAQLRLNHPLEARAFVQRSDALGPDPLTLAMATRVETAAGDTVAAAKYRQRLHSEFPKYAPTGEGARKP